MPLTAHAVYDFEANEEHGELSLTAGQVVTVHRQDIGEGWWEGEVDGRRGLFPAAYVELDEGGAVGGAGDHDDFDDDDDASDWEDSGDDFDDDPGHHHHHQQQQHQQQHGQGIPHMEQPPGFAMSSSTAPSSDAQTYGGSASSYGRAGTLKKSVNRFSVFVKAGAEAFLIGATKDKTIDASNMLHIFQSKDGPAWTESQQTYPEITVEHDGSRSKFKGIKTFEAYRVHTGGTQVERRYKHFAWLHDRLVEKYSCMCVPPMPGKDYAQKFGESMVDKRQHRLTMWLNRICRHPVLSGDSLALKHFLTCPTSDKAQWKEGKRKAEKDDFVGSMFFKLISQDVPCPNDSDKEIEQFEKFVAAMSKAVKRNIDVASRFSDRMAGTFKSEYGRVSSSLQLLGTTFAQGGGQVNGDSVRLSTAFVKAAGKVNEIAELHEKQPVNDQIPLMEGMKEYQGLLGQFSGCIVSSRSASMRVEEIENNEEAKPGEKDAVRSRCDVIHTLALCEMSHFHQQRRGDFRDMMSSYFDAQIKFHEEIAAKLREAKAEFDSLNF